MENTPALSATPISPSATLATRDFITGAICAVSAVAIWAGWLVMMRLGVTTTIAAPDIAVLRFTVAGLILLPIVWRRGLALDRLGVWGLAALAIGGGAPYLLLVGVGLLFAPVAHAGALTQGIIPLTIALVAAVALKERPGRMQTVGLVLVISGGLVIGGVGTADLGGAEGFGHLCFLASAFLCAFYTVAMRLAWTASMLRLSLPSLPLSDILVQALYQGVLTAAISIALYGRAVRLLGASAAGAFVALGPVIAAVISIPVLGEMPSSAEWFAIATISVGVYLASGGLQLRRARAETSYWSE